MKNQKGFTLIELVVVMVILALLAAVAVPKFIDLQKQAEAASVKNVLGSVRSALSLRVARALANSEDLATLPYNGSNALDPMDSLLSNKPETYLGVLTANDSTKGAWYDYNGTGGANSHDLVYVLKNSDIVSTSQAQQGVHKLRFRIEAIQETIDGNSVITGLELVPRTPASFDWLY